MSTAVHATPAFAGLRGDVHSEWDEVKQHDVLFLLTIRPPDAAALASMAASGAPSRPDLLHGLTYVRGCEVIEVSTCAVVESAVCSGILGQKGFWGR